MTAAAADAQPYPPAEQRRILSEAVLHLLASRLRIRITAQVVRAHPTRRQERHRRGLRHTQAGPRPSRPPQRDPRTHKVGHAMSDRIGEATEQGGGWADDLYWEDCCNWYYAAASLAQGDGYWPSMISIEFDCEGTITADDARGLAAMLIRAADACDASQEHLGLTPAASQPPVSVSDGEGTNTGDTA